MTLKSAAFLALVGTALLSFLLAAVFLRDCSAFFGGAISLMALLQSAIQLFASLSLALFLFTFHKAER